MVLIPPLKVYNHKEREGYIYMTDRCDKCNREKIDKLFGVWLASEIWLCGECHETWLEFFTKELPQKKIKELLNRGKKYYEEVWDRLYNMWKSGHVVPEVVIFT